MCASTDTSTDQLLLSSGCNTVKPTKYSSSEKNPSIDNPKSSTSVTYPNHVIPKCHENISIGTLNVCGLKTRSNYPEFIDLINKFDIFCVTETKLDIYDNISIPNYNLLSKVRKQE